MIVSFFRNIIKTKSCHWVVKRNLNVLGIETSCDETSAAVVNDSGKILGEGHFSQSKLHAESGGIIPIIAYNLHVQFIKTMVETAMEKSLLSFKNIDAIAVTVKPGIVLSLKVGLEQAKDLCILHSKPLIPIHHMEAHALTARLTEDVKFPYLAFLLSGRHCILTVVESVDKFKTLGNSVNNSPGHALDVIARRAKLKNLKKFKGLCGGAAIEAAAVDGDSSVFHFPNQNMASHGKSCDSSFGYLITCANTHIQNEEKKHNVEPDEVIPNINDLCASVLLALTRHLCQRLEVAFNYINITNMLKDDEKCLVMSGGVACNNFIYKAFKRLCDNYGYKLVVPPARLCSDNGVMVAWNGIERLKVNLPVVQPNDLSSVTESFRCFLGEDLSEDVKAKSKLMTFKYMKWKSYSDIAAGEEKSEAKIQ